MSLAPPAPSSQLAPGFRLDRYELLCPIAEGGMATVWVARQTGKHGFEKLVAVKMILPKFAADPAFQKMFRDEARIASRIEHANATQILDVGEQQEMTYLVMEYVDGDALSAIYRTLKKHNLKIPPGVVLRVLADACGALHAAHELRDESGVLLNVVHRDVSPQNLLVSTKGVAKIIDFGIAKARDRVSGDTNTGQVKGKVRYMAPEQAMGRTIDRRADIWAVGAILYHMLAGKPPYDGETDVQALMALTSGKPPVPLPQTVPASVVKVVKRALAPAPEARYATAAEMQQAIEDAMTEARLSTSAAAIATFLGKHVPDRIQKRKDAIALGLKAAAERDRVAEVMRSNAEIHIGSLSATGAGQGSAPRMITATGAHSAVTSGTLGSAAIDLGAAGASKSRAVILAAVGGGAFVGLAGMLAMFLHSSSASIPGAAGGVASASTRPAVAAGEVPQGAAAGRDAGAALPGLPATPVIEATDLPILPASALPKVPPPAYNPTPAAPAREGPRPAAVGAPPAPRPSPPSGPTPSKRRSVDDGF
ncbi:MAG: serine/threonine-protein kinase [Polyangiaceae bacterium]